MDRKGKISKEEIPGSKRSMYDLFQALKGERLSSVFSPDGILISASAAPHCEAARVKDVLQQWTVSTDLGDPTVFETETDEEFLRENFSAIWLLQLTAV